jgi:triphosphoribosyl-dephospho-CoA synthase
MKWTPGHCAALACQLEVAIPKPGNVHRGADFSDTTIYDFLLAGQILGQVIDEHRAASCGWTVLESVRATRAATGNNPNLGIVLLLVPLARLAAAGLPLSVAAMATRLDQLTARDARDVYAAIRLAQPGGLGEVETDDVAGEPARGLVDAMRLAASRDAVAAEYAHAFAATIDDHAPRLVQLLKQHNRLDRAVIELHVELLARAGDSLIRRKGGDAVAGEAQRRAEKCLATRAGGWEAFEAALGELDFWLRSDGNRRNPGTTADLIAASLFVGLWRGELGLQGSLPSH